MFRFLRQYLKTAISGGIGTTFVVGGYLRDIWEVATLGLPNEVWQAVGAFLIIASIFSVLYRHQLAIEGVSGGAGEPIVPPPKPDYDIWRKSETLTLTEIASLCADEEPMARSKTGKSHSFKNLLVQGVESGDIHRSDGEIRKTSPRYGHPVEEYEHFGPLEFYSRVYVDDVARYFKSKGIKTKFFKDWKIK